MNGRYRVKGIALTVMAGKSLYPFSCGGECVVENDSMMFSTEDDKEMASKQYKFHFGGEGNVCPPGFAVLGNDFPDGLHFSCGLAPGVLINLYVEKVPSE